MSDMYYPYRKRLNTEIVTKTEIAMNAIKKYEMQQSRINFNRNEKFNEKTMMNELDIDYSRLTPHKKIDLDQVYHISLFTYSQQFYCLEMINYVFPMRVLFKNVKNDGILYIGYDQEYPGIQHHNKLSIFENQTGEYERNYDFKEQICQDMLITLKNKGNKIVKYVYFTISAGSSLLMFDFKVQFLGFMRNDRILSEGKFKNPTKIDLGKGWERSQMLARQKTQQLPVNKQTKFPEISKINNEKLVKLEQFHVFTQGLPKHFSKESIAPSKQLSSRQNYNPHNNSHTLMLKMKGQSQNLIKQAKILTGGNPTKGDVDLKIQEIKRNKQLHDIWKHKDKQLREIAGKCKRLIENYQKVYNEESVRKKKLNKDIVIILYSALYVNKIHKRCQKTIKKQNMKFKVLYLCKKFIKKLKRKHQQTCKLQPYRYKRLINEEIAALQLETKLLHKNSVIRASKNIMGIFSYLSSLISLNKAINASNIYRNKVILIQRSWKSKYQNRLKCLLQFIDQHVKKMTNQYQNLRLFVDQFYNKGINREICLNYIKDESHKYRFIYDAYQRKLEQIEEIIYVNQQMSFENSNKSRLIVPKKPIKPMHRFYRNCDILKSMIRNWFQIQYKKYWKKNSQKILK